MSERDDPDRYGDGYRPKRPHWCSVCLGHTGPGSPCVDDDEPEDEEPEDGQEE